VTENSSSAKKGARAKAAPSRTAVAFTRLGILVFILGAWEFGVHGQNVTFFSRPTLVAQQLIALLGSGQIYPHIRTTLSEIVIGYLIGSLAGLALGFLLGRSRFLSDVFQPYIMAFYSIPKIAVAPLFIIWFGLGIQSKIAIVVLSAFFLVFFNTFAGMQGLNQDFINLARLMGATKTQTIFRVILPAAAPSILIGLRMAVPYAVIGAIIGEFIGSNQGLGYFILYAAQTFDASSLFAGIIILVSIVFLVNQGLMAVERRALRWRPTEQTAIQV
jgi:NitT/TauT family transport system permease protein